MANHEASTYLMHEKLSDYITEKGIKKTAIANVIGISSQSLHYKLTGENRFYANEYMAICDFLDVSPTRFIERKEE